MIIFTCWELLLANPGLILVAPICGISHTLTTPSAQPLKPKYITSKLFLFTFTNCKVKLGLFQVQACMKTKSGLEHHLPSTQKLRWVNLSHGVAPFSHHDRCMVFYTLLAHPVVVITSAPDFQTIFSSCRCQLLPCWVPPQTTHISLKAVSKVSIYLFMIEWSQSITLCWTI